MSRVNVRGIPKTSARLALVGMLDVQTVSRIPHCLKVIEKKIDFLTLVLAAGVRGSGGMSSVRRPLPLTSGCHKSAQAGAVLSRTVCWEASRLRARAGFLSIRGACGGGGGSGRAESVQSCTQLHTHQPRICSPAAVKPQPLTWQSAAGRASAI